MPDAGMVAQGGPEKTYFKGMKQEELSNWIRRVEQKIAGAQKRTRAIVPKVDPPAAAGEAPQPLPQSAQASRDTA